MLPHAAAAIALLFVLSPSGLLASVVSNAVSVFSSGAENLSNTQNVLPPSWEPNTYISKCSQLFLSLNDKKLSVAKVKEEIGELIEAVEQNSNKIHEAADVLYHLMGYLEANNIKIEDVMSELKKRQK